MNHCGITNGQYKSYSLVFKQTNRQIKITTNQQKHEQNMYQIFITYFLCHFRHTARSLNLMLKICVASSGISGRDRIVVSTSRCGRDNPGSNPGHGMPALLPLHNGPSYLFVVVVIKTRLARLTPFIFSNWPTFWMISSMYNA